MAEFKENRGSYGVLDSLAGVASPTPKEETEIKKPIYTEDEPEWMTQAKKDWLSIDNDMLFEVIGGLVD